MEIREERVVVEGKHISTMVTDCTIGGRRIDYEWAKRTNPRVVIVVALTEENEIIFVEEPRVIPRMEMISLPAGLMDKPGKSVIEIAAEELLEEAGYEAEHLEIIQGGKDGQYISAGSNNERAFLVAAIGARKICEPQQNEETKPILVPAEEAVNWVLDHPEVERIDLKVAGHLLVFERWLAKRRKNGS